MNISDNIKAIRKEKGLTQTEVAKRYGTSPEFYHRLEKKGNKLTIEQAEKIASAIGVSLTELLENAATSNAKNQNRLEQLERENEDLTRQIAIYEPLAKMVNLLLSNPSRMEDFSNKVSTGKVGKADIETTFPDIKEAFENSNKETK